MGIPVFAPFIEKKPIIFSKDFYVQCFDLPHDGTENYGFLITWGGQRILYMTDFEYCKYRFKDIHHLIIECNYQEKYVETDSASFEHKVKGHCSLNTCKDFVKVNSSDALRTVLLTHLGAETAVGNEIVDEVKKVARKGICVDYARKGLCIELRETDCPF